MDLRSFSEKATARSTANKKFLQQLKKKDGRKVDTQFHQIHEEVFAETDCLTCANCCKTTSPIFYQTDIERAAKALRLKPGDFVDRYLKVDADKDYVLNTSPCAFLGNDNRCSIYEARPKACREYPHTDRKKITQILDLTYKNTLVCPAVLEMVERIKALH
ncbi:MAG: YkgJ family cysteine cluster protein [Bacteroidetes bacterium]|nr:YkgJ family cysteine cluster protein [Bacteroidota bacterium]MBS1541539.1 YkgJ family cysteine cluster protein [Bacteroidota bacterium]